MPDGDIFPRSPICCAYPCWSTSGWSGRTSGNREIWALLENFSVAEPIRRDPAGLDKLMRRTEGEFSLGEYRRLCLAVFWAADFDVLLLDEPTASLDVENIQAIVRAIARLKGGKTLIIASHDNALQANADRIIQL